MSTSASHSYPMVSLPSVTVWFPVSAATGVPRQKRSLEKLAVMTGSPDPRLTMKIGPSRAFSGLPPSSGGLKRGSRQVPVQTPVGSIWALSSVSLYVTSVRNAVCALSIEVSQRVFQNMSLPVKSARFTPASRAASTAARSPADQYSSWPDESSTLWFFSRLGSRSTSMLVV